MNKPKREKPVNQEVEIVETDDPAKVQVVETVDQTKVEVVEAQETLNE